MILERGFEPVEILLVEDNPGDVRLILEAFREGKIYNHLSVVSDGVEAMAPGRTSFYLTLTSPRRMVGMSLRRSRKRNL
jgi:CheY-like chemotaxis protein